MARKKKDNPTNMAADDVAETLRAASGDLVEAKEGLEAARQPIRDAKAQIKATGMPFDVFNLFHGIRHLEKDEDRQKRIRQVQVCWAALLKDHVTPDLFAGDLIPAVAPAMGQALRDASDTLRQEEPEAAAEPQDQEIPFDPPSVPTPDEPVEDVPALVAAETMPEGAGHIANNGLQAGRKGFDADANPHEVGSPEAKLWEDGRQRGAALGPAEEGTEAVEPPASDTVTELPTPKRAPKSRAEKVAAYYAGFDGAAQSLFSEDCPHDRGALKAEWLAGLKDAKEGKAPRWVRPSAGEQQVDTAPESAEPADGADPGEETEPARVDVREVDGKPMLFDLLAGSPLMDVSSLRTGETWAAQINEYFVDRLDSVTRNELVDAAKTLARGRMLMAPAPGAPPAYDLRSAV